MVSSWFWGWVGAGGLGRLCFLGISVVSMRPTGFQALEEQTGYAADIVTAMLKGVPKASLQVSCCCGMV